MQWRKGLKAIACFGPQLPMAHRGAALKAAAERRQAELRPIALYGGSADGAAGVQRLLPRPEPDFDALSAAGKRRAVKTVGRSFGPKASIR